VNCTIQVLDEGVVVFLLPGGVVEVHGQEGAVHQGAMVESSKEKILAVAVCRPG